MNRESQARTGRLMLRGSAQYARSAASYIDERTEEIVSLRRGPRETRDEQERERERGRGTA
jgi:hypothetical protein